MVATEDDAVLWRRVLAGDGAAYGELYERHADSIYRYLFRRVADWADAEDLTAVVFLEAYRGRRSVKLSDGSLLPWLYGIATNLLRTRRRTAARHRRALARLELATTTRPPVADVDARLAAQIEARQVLENIRRLPRAQRDVVALCLYQGVSYQDAAVALQLPVGTIRSRLARARASLERAQQGSSSTPEEAAT
jgi:RNA polymerase sigma factor (sigma-70 family)